jgi:hypothetical protein
VRVWVGGLLFLHEGVTNVTSTDRHSPLPSRQLYIVGFLLTLVGLIMEFVIERRNSGDEMCVRVLRLLPSALFGSLSQNWTVYLLAMRA